MFIFYFKCSNDRGNFNDKHCTCDVLMLWWCDPCELVLCLLFDRYAIYHHPWISAFVGISFNSFMLTLLLLVRWASRGRADIDVQADEDDPLADGEDGARELPDGGAFLDFNGNLAVERDLRRNEGNRNRANREAGDNMQNEANAQNGPENGQNVPNEPENVPANGQNVPNEANGENGGGAGGEDEPPADVPPAVQAGAPEEARMEALEEAEGSEADGASEHSSSTHCSLDTDDIDQLDV